MLEFTSLSASTLEDAKCLFSGWFSTCVGTCVISPLRTEQVLHIVSKCSTDRSVVAVLIANAS